MEGTASSSEGAVIGALVSVIVLVLAGAVYYNYTTPDEEDQQGPDGNVWNDPENQLNLQIEEKTHDASESNNYQYDMQPPVEQGEESYYQKPPWEEENPHYDRATDVNNTEENDYLAPVPLEEQDHNDESDEHTDITESDDDENNGEPYYTQINRDNEFDL